MKKISYSVAKKIIKQYPINYKLIFENNKRLNEFYIKFGLDLIPPQKIKSYIDGNLPIIYQQILDSTCDLINPRFNERLYCYVNDIFDTPICSNITCTNRVKFLGVRPFRYNRYCSQKCSIKDMKTLIGVENSSQLQTVKDKKKKNAQQKYGVDNVSKSQEIRDIISKKQIAVWEKKFDVLKEQIKSIDVLTMTEKEYNRLTHKISDWNYRTYTDKIDPERKRGTAWHLDHKFSIFQGYLNHIPPHIIGDITNLEIISGKKNAGKSYRCSITLEQLLDDYNKFYETNEKLLNDYTAYKPNRSSKTVYRENITGSCFTCGKLSHYFYSKSEKWCCEPSRNSCPVMRKKNSICQEINRKKREVKKQDYASPTSSIPSPVV